MEVACSFSNLLWKIRPADAVKQDSSPLHPLSEVVWDQHIDFFFCGQSYFSRGYGLEQIGVTFGSIVGWNCGVWLLYGV